MARAFRVTVQVATDDPSVGLPDLMRGLEEQSDPPQSLVVVDNALPGRSRPSEPTGFPVIWLRNTRPQGYGRSHGQAMALAAAHRKDQDPRHTVLLCTMPDIWPDAELLRRLSAAFEEDDHLAVAGPKIRRSHVVGSLDGERRELELTDTLASAGLTFAVFGRTKTIGAGEKDDGRFDAMPANAPDPVCFAVRLSSLLALSHQGPWLAEDADARSSAIGLFRRLLAAGGSARVLPQAFAWQLAARPSSE